MARESSPGANKFPFPHEAVASPGVQEYDAAAAAAKLRLWVAGSVGMAVIALRQAKAADTLRSQSRTGNALFVFVGGLLGSSCCLLQLSLNWLSLGCAGFSALDVLRPFFLATTFGALAMRSALERRDGVRNPRPASWAAALTLSFLPELIRLHNRYGLGLGLGLGRKAASLPLESAVAHATVAGIKCEACARGLYLRVLEAAEADYQARGGDSGSGGGGGDGSGGSDNGDGSGKRGSGRGWRVALCSVTWHSADRTTVVLTLERGAAADEASSPSERCAEGASEAHGAAVAAAPAEAGNSAQCRRERSAVSVSAAVLTAVCEDLGCSWAPLADRPASPSEL